MNTPVTMNMNAPMMTKKQTNPPNATYIIHRFKRCVCAYIYINLCKYFL